MVFLKIKFRKEVLYSFIFIDFKRNVKYGFYFSGWGYEWWNNEYFY